MLVLGSFKLRRKVFITIAFIAILFSVLSISAQNEFAGGSGTEEDPWLIETAEHLNLVGSYTGEEYVNYFFKQIADIDLYEATREGGQFWNDGSGWTSIGNELEYFYANYDGNGHTISGYYINANCSQGLFGYISGANISNLGVINIDVNGGDHTGGLVGKSTNLSRVENCYSRGRVRGESFVGGLVGYNDKSALVTTFSTAYVEGEAYLGGLVGLRQAGEGYLDVSNFWDIQSSGQNISAMGVGRSTADMTYPYSENTYIQWDFYEVWVAVADFDSNNGYPVLKIRENSFAPSPVSTLYPQEGADSILIDSSLSWIINYNESYTNSPAGFKISLGTDNPPTNILHNHNLGWQVSFEPTLLLERDRVYYWQVVPYNEFGEAETSEIWAFNTNLFAGGLGTESAPWLIETPNQLRNIVLFVGREHRNRHFRQTTDIDLNVAPWNSGEGWLPIGSNNLMFHGNYNGNGFSINNLYINRPDSNNVGLFGFCFEAKISNVNLVNHDVTGGRWVGALVGDFTGGYFSTRGKISNCSAIGRVTGHSRVGGLIGYTIRTDTENCWAVSEVIGLSYYDVRAGGLVGFLSTDSTIRNSYATGSVITANNSTLVGGLVGISTSSSVYDSFASTNISGGDQIGGLIGHKWEGNVINCSSSGNVHGIEKVGGMIGIVFRSTISESFSVINVLGSYAVGGLVGMTDSYSSIANCYSRSSVRGQSAIGGLIGSSGSNSIINCYSAGSVTGEDDIVGGLVGHRDHEIVEFTNYWDIDISNQATSAVGYGRTTEEMTFPYTENTYEDWDFDEVWIADENHQINDGYPYLRMVTPPQLSPIAINAIAGDSFVHLNWEMSPGLNPVSFNVYRDDRLRNPEPLTDFSYIDDDVINFNTYNYYVTANYIEFEESAPSPSVSVTPLAAPRNLSAVVVAERDVLLEWEAPVIEEELGLSRSVDPISTNYRSNFFHSRSTAERNYELTGFKLYRNEEIVTQLEPTELTYLDQDLDYGLHHYHVTALYDDLESIHHDTIEVQIIDLDADNDLQTPLVTDLIGNYPNPFNPETSISFSLAEAGEVRLDIYNLRGQRVKTLVSDHLQPGYHQIVWEGMNENGKEVSSGVYFYALRANDTTMIRKMMVVK